MPEETVQQPVETAPEPVAPAADQPVAPALETAPEAPGPVDDTFSQLVDEFESLDSPDFAARQAAPAAATSEPAPVPAVAAPSQPPSPPAVPGVPQLSSSPRVPSPAVPQPAAAQPPTAPQQVPPQAPPQFEWTPERIQQARKQLQEYISSQYTLTPEEAVEAVAEPEKFFPKMIGRLYLDVYDSIHRATVAQIPAMTQAQLVAAQRNQQAEDEFFGRWPNLRDPQYQQSIMREAYAYRQLYPQATRQEVIEQVGPRVALKHGIVLDAPQTDSTPNPPAAKPFTPSQPQRVASTPPVRKVDDNDWASIATWEER